MAFNRVMWVSLVLVVMGCDSGGSHNSDEESTDAGTAGRVIVADAVSIVESGNADIALRLEGESAVTVTYATNEGSASADDFVAATGSITLEPAHPMATVTLQIEDDFLRESAESFSVHWTVSDAAVAVTPATTITITDNDELTVLPAAGTWDAIDLFNPATDCNQCHKASNLGTSPAAMRSGNTEPDPAGTDISPGADWRHSLMAHSFTDPAYTAKVASEAAENPHLGSFIEDKCLGCHAPMAHVLAKETGRLITEGDDPTCMKAEGCLSLATALADPVAREGISCTLCHRIDGRVMTEDRHSGDYPLDASAPNPLIFGPFAAPLQQPMLNQLGKLATYSDHMLRSEHCASCHDLFTPVLDAVSRQPSGDEFPEQTPFREWANSAFARGNPGAKECQECHMPAAGDLVTPIAVRGNGTVNPAWPERTPYAQHVFVGGNTHMLTVLKNYRSTLGIAAVTSTGGFDQKIAETRSLLATAATLSISNTAVSNGELVANVTITNQSGHKLPTGFPSRRVWIALTVTANGGEVIFSSGEPDEQGRLAIDTQLSDSTCTAALAPVESCLVPHYDSITQPSQVPIYESVLGTNNGLLTHTLLLADHYLKDNRLPPLGFSASSASYDDATAIIGIGGDADFNVAGSGSDTIHYQIPLNGNAGPWNVEARLYLQSIKPSHIASIRADTITGHNFRIMMAETPPLPELLASDQAAVAP